MTDADATSCSLVLEQVACAWCLYNVKSTAVSLHCFLKEIWCISVTGTMKTLHQTHATAELLERERLPSISLLIRPANSPAHSQVNYCVRNYARESVSNVAAIWMTHTTTEKYAVNITLTFCNHNCQHFIASRLTHIECAYFLHFSQLYMLSPLRSSAEKKAARQSCSVITGPQNQLFNTHAHTPVQQPFST